MYALIIAYDIHDDENRRSLLALIQKDQGVRLSESCWLVTSSVDAKATYATVSKYATGVDDSLWLIDTSGGIEGSGSREQNKDIRAVIAAAQVIRQR